MEFDYIVVGAGSAGCAVAGRLSEQGDATVALIEAGGKDTNPWIHIPVGYFKTMHNPSCDWMYATEPDPGINGRSLQWPRGKVLGGSSSLNGLLYVRGQPADYDSWRQAGNTGWGWDEVLPYFRKAENQERGADDYHGVDGPLSVSNMRLERQICNEWVEAAQNAGYKYNPDYNGADQEGVGYFQLTTKNGMRCSSATAYLKPARKRETLEVVTKAHVRRIIFTGKRATGVEIERKGKVEVLNARREIILSAGAIGSPQILMLSGVGDPEQLNEINIPLVHAAKDVGGNLQDHLQARLVYKCQRPTMNDEVNSLIGKAKIAAEFALKRSGPMTMAASLAVAFLKTRPELETPDIQFHIQPWSADSPGEGVHPFSAFTASVCQLRPESAGRIVLDPQNPTGAPKIHPNYLATPLDCSTVVEGVKIARKIAEQDPLRGAISEEFRPGPGFASDEDLLAWVRDTATTIYHPTGTCRMGQDSNAVVDERLRVRGVEGLRVADCSIMPTIVSGNTNAPAIMIGEKIADMLREDAKQTAGAA